MNGFVAPDLIPWFQQNPFVLIAIAILVIIFVASKARGGRRGRTGVPTDPTRLFKPAQKNAAGVNCGDSRCEHKAPLWFRCHARGTHGDHVYPHSKGGATTMSNLQLLCPTHNLRKSATIPSAMYIWRLERRRAKYFPAGVSGKVEWRIGRAW